MNQRSLSEKRSKKAYSKRVVALKKIDEYLETNGPMSISQFVMEVDILRSTLYQFKEFGYLHTKRPSRDLILYGVNWTNVNYTPLVQSYQNEQLSRIRKLTETRSVTLKQLNSLTGIEISTLRYWAKKNILLSEIKGERIYITGVKDE